MMKAKHTIALTALIGLFLCACDPAKRAQRREDKLVDQAGASRSVLARLYPVITGLWPCANDSATTVIPGRTDSPALASLAPGATVFTQPGTNPVKSPDFGLYRDSITKKLVDSLRTLCTGYMMASFDSGYARAAAECRAIKIPVKRPDTVRITVLDRKALQVAADSLHARDKAIAKLQGQSEQKDATIKKQGKIILYLSIGTALLFVILIVVIIKRFI